VNIANNIWRGFCSNRYLKNFKDKLISIKEAKKYQKEKIPAGRFTSATTISPELWLTPWQIFFDPIMLRPIFDARIVIRFCLSPSPVPSFSWAPGRAPALPGLFMVAVITVFLIKIHVQTSEQSHRDLKPVIRWKYFVLTIS